MTSMQTHFKNLGRVTIFVMFFALFLQGCMPKAKGKKPAQRKATASATTDTPKTPPPVFSNVTNFIQNGASVFLTTTKLDINFSDSIQLRGKEVDAYIRAAGTSNVVCLASQFESSKVIVLLAAVPRSIYNFTTQSKEYYYNIAPSDNSSNQSFCQKAGLMSQLSTLYPTFTLKYKMSEICATAGVCKVSSYSSQGLELFNQSGNPITQVMTKQLLFLINNNPLSQNPTGQTCTDSSQCKTQGYDCCNSGQCVKDLAQIPGSSGVNFDQALQDILNNPSAIYNYPQFYYICSSPTKDPSGPIDTTDPQNEASLRVKRLENLYNCTSKIEGEYGVCTVMHENVKLSKPIDSPENKKYSAGNDDRNFKTTFTNSDNIDLNSLVSIEKLIYGGVVIYDYTRTEVNKLIVSYINDSTPQTPAFGITGDNNDDGENGAFVKLYKKPVAATSDTLEIKYKIDASCSLINKSLAKCEKYYIQGQNSKRGNIQKFVTDHFPGTDKFKIPLYANLGKAITVEVDGLLQKRESDWELIEGAPGIIQFYPSKVTDGQKVRITYYADITTETKVNNIIVKVPNIMSSKLKALEDIKSICSCPDLKCSLLPIENASKKIVDYACVFPEPPAVEPPISQKIFVSSKSVPVRFFDKVGNSQSTVNAGMGQQDGTVFKYDNDDLLKPSNLNNYIGFNEIYGSISYSNGSAKPAHQVNVKKGNTYDIYVDRGSFSNCIQCGNDYYSQLTKLFPLTQFGSGVKPLIGQTNRSMTTGIRSDDLKFGRACVVPATMIPWSHAPKSSERDQRNSRMDTQHFFYANGYQYDWYGFDYGSVIGSFDGVKWFSIGTNRRIKAESSKMFVAVNGAMGDLTLEATYEVTVNDGSLNPLGSNMVTSDFNSDGAECQQFHQCSTDNDCASTLGWEYACAPVGEITTTWPKFDDNGKEIPEIVREDNRLAAILGVSNPGKRCVYRGRGALCSPNFSNINVNSTFNTSTSKAMHSCSDNNYCEAISVNGLASQKFNDTIVRYGKVRVDSNVDTFGLAALIPGRPTSWNPTRAAADNILRNLNKTKSQAMCLPGRDIEKNSFLEQNSTTPTDPDYKGDKVLGIGMTYKKSAAVNDNYLNACSIMDSSKNYYRNSSTNPSALFKLDAGSQAVSTNSLSIFNTIFNAKGIKFDLLKTNSMILNSVSFTENRCMRAPAASCFTDLDCSPSKVISDKLKSISAEDSVVTAILNKYEVKFWQEELICSQPIAKTSSTYDPKNNYCCRDVGNTISLPSADIINELNYKKVPGIDTAITDKTRYTRAATMYKLTNDPDNSNFPELRTAVTDQCNKPGGCLTINNTLSLDKQFRTFATFAEKTSCSGDWVRPFVTGNHKWEASRFQTFTPATFQCMNWYPGNGGYTCAGYEADDPSCPLAQTTSSSPKGKNVLDYLAKLELMGIPQIYFEKKSFFTEPTLTGPENGLSCKSDPSGRQKSYTTYMTPIQLFADGAVAEYIDESREYLSAIDSKNFKTMKQIFKSDEVVSCLPAGTNMKQGDDPEKCCTGMINASTLKCQLPDYVDVSVYTNRYVSSEAKRLNDSLFDQSGYLKDATYAAQIACEKQICASGTLAFGILISKLPTPGQLQTDAKYYRFLEGNSVDNTNGLLDLYNKGLKLNNHAYCVPKSVAQSATSANSNDLTVFSCEN